MAMTPNQLIRMLGLALSLLITATAATPVLAADSADGMGPRYQGGNKGGKPEEAGEIKGEDYGDLWVILRDANGEPILTAFPATVAYKECVGLVQPLDVNNVVISWEIDEAGDCVLADEEAVQEVDFGRLNIARSPSSVILQALDDVLVSINTASSVVRDPAGRLVLNYLDGTSKTVDAPLQNLALYHDIMNDGVINGVTKSASALGELACMVQGGPDINDLDLAASFLGAAADKAGKVTVDTVVYLNTILGLNNPPENTYYDFSILGAERLPSRYAEPVSWLELRPDGLYEMIMNLKYDVAFAVFGGTRALGKSGRYAENFALAADEARAIVEFLHTCEHDIIP